MLQNKSKTHDQKMIQGMYIGEGRDVQLNPSFARKFFDFLGKSTEFERKNNQSDSYIYLSVKILNTELEIRSSIMLDTYRSLN